MRVLLAVSLLLLLPFSGALAQSPAASPSLTLTPRLGNTTTSHVLQGHGLPPNSSLPVVLFDPSGNETVLQAQTGSTGDFVLSLVPSGVPWRSGLYRVVVGLPTGAALDATFVASDGSPQLVEEPYLPSPTSAFEFVGTGLPPRTTIHLTLWLTAGEGPHPLTATTDADGTFALFVWPEQFGRPFYAAGDYVIEAPDLGLVTHFAVREHPVSSAAAVAGPIPPAGNVPLTLRYYPANTYVWGVYQTADGAHQGEFLVGPTSARGDLGTVLQLGPLAPGQYYLATPYQWGETTFTVPAPPPTAAPLPTATALPTATPHSTKKTKTHYTKCVKWSHHKCVKKRTVKCSRWAKKHKKCR